MNEPFGPQNFRRRTFTAAEIARGREAALAAYDAAQAAILWALDRSLDPAAPLDNPPPPWSTASTTTVDNAQTELDWLKEN
ncbi:hypothetical protein [Mycolicibacterium rhodesiae]|nr:hypothetical protein [Mycolicibacterium rhodesiae]MCV7342970.1 hypothetical protein [Mycolicibacterium rhodesiae]